MPFREEEILAFQKVDIHIVIRVTTLNPYKLQTARKLKSALNRPYKTLWERHVNDFSALYDRCGLYLGEVPGSKDPTDVRLKNFAEGKYDPSLIALYFHPQ